MFSFGVISDFLFENTLIVVTSNLWEFHGFISDKIWTWLEENNYELKAAVEERLPLFYCVLHFKPFGEYNRFHMIVVFRIFLFAFLGSNKTRIAQDAISNYLTVFSIFIFIC